MQHQNVNQPERRTQLRPPNMSASQSSAVASTSSAHQVFPTPDDDRSMSTRNSLPTPPPSATTASSAPDSGYSPSAPSIYAQRPQSYSAVSAQNYVSNQSAMMSVSLGKRPHPTITIPPAPQLGSTFLNRVPPQQISQRQQDLMAPQHRQQLLQQSQSQSQWQIMSGPFSQDSRFAHADHPSRPTPPLPRSASAQQSQQQLHSPSVSSPLGQYPIRFSATNVPPSSQQSQTYTYRLPQPGSRSTAQAKSRSSAASPIGQPVMSPNTSAFVSELSSVHIQAPFNTTLDTSVHSRQRSHSGQSPGGISTPTSSTIREPRQQSHPAAQNALEPAAMAERPRTMNASTHAQLLLKPVTELHQQMYQTVHTELTQELTRISIDFEQLRMQLREANAHCQRLHDECRRLQEEHTRMHQEVSQVHETTKSQLAVAQHERDTLKLHYAKVRQGAINEYNENIRLREMIRALREVSLQTKRSRGVNTGVDEAVGEEPAVDNYMPPSDGETEWRESAASVLVEGTQLPRRVIELVASTVRQRFEVQLSAEREARIKAENDLAALKQLNSSNLTAVPVVDGTPSGHGPSPATDTDTLVDTPALVPTVKDEPQDQPWPWTQLEVIDLTDLLDSPTAEHSGDNIRLTPSLDVGKHMLQGDTPDAHPNKRQRVSEDVEMANPTPSEDPADNIISSPPAPDSAPPIDVGSDKMSIIQTPSSLVNGDTNMVEVKTEVDESSQPKTLSIRHLDLIYYTAPEKGKLLCRMCISRQNEHEEAPLTVFSQRAGWSELSGHCEKEHPMAFESLINMTPSQVEEIREVLKRM